MTVSFFIIFMKFKIPDIFFFDATNRMVYAILIYCVNEKSRKQIFAVNEDR